jgi:hypothetical protein
MWTAKRARLGWNSLVVVLAALTASACDLHSPIESTANRLATGVDRPRNLTSNRRLSADEVATAIRASHVPPTSWAVSHGPVGALLNLVRSDETISSAGTDTLFGFINAAIYPAGYGLDNGEATGATWATQHRSPATVASIAWGTVQVGTDFPYDWNDYCDGEAPSPQYCNWGQDFDVSCILGSEVDATENDTVLYTTGDPYGGEISKSARCGPPLNGGGSQNNECGIWDVDISFDGGVSWTNIGTINDC